MAKLEMGNGFKALVAFLLWAALFGSGFLFGKIYEQNAQTTSNNKVLAIDTEVGQEISSETKADKENLDEKIIKLKEPVIDSDGYVSAEFMQLIQSTKSNAERRNNKGNILHTFTHP